MLMKNALMKLASQVPTTMCEIYKLTDSSSAQNIH